MFIFMMRWLPLTADTCAVSPSFSFLNGSLVTAFYDEGKPVLSTVKKQVSSCGQRCHILNK